MEYPNCREIAPLNPLTVAPTVLDGDFIRWGKSFSFILHSFVIEGESDCDKCDCDKCDCDECDWGECDSPLRISMIA